MKTQNPASAGFLCAKLYRKDNVKRYKKHHMSCGVFLYNDLIRRYFCVVKYTSVRERSLLKMKIFNKNFYKFLFNFIAVIAVTLLIILLVGAMAA